MEIKKFVRRFKAKNGVKEVKEKCGKMSKMCLLWGQKGIGKCYKENKFVKVPQKVLQFAQRYSILFMEDSRAAKRQSWRMLPTPGMWRKRWHNM